MDPKRAMENFLYLKPQHSQPSSQKYEAIPSLKRKTTCSLVMFPRTSHSFQTPHLAGNGEWVLVGMSHYAGAQYGKSIIIEQA